MIFDVDDKVWGFSFFPNFIVSEYVITKEARNRTEDGRYAMQKGSIFFNPYILGFVDDI